MSPQLDKALASLIETVDQILTIALVVALAYGFLLLAAWTAK